MHSQISERKHDHQGFQANNTDTTRSLQAERVRKKEIKTLHHSCKFLLTGLICKYPPSRHFYSPWLKWSKHTSVNHAPAFGGSRFDHTSGSNEQIIVYAYETNFLPNTSVHETSVHKTSSTKRVSTKRYIYESCFYDAHLLLPTELKRSEKQGEIWRAVPATQQPTALLLFSPRLWLGFPSEGMIVTTRVPSRLNQ